MRLISNLRKISVILSAIVVLRLISGCVKTGVPEYDARRASAIENQNIMIDINYYVD